MLLKKLKIIIGKNSLNGLNEKVLPGQANYEENPIVDYENPISLCEKLSRLKKRSERVKSYVTRLS